VGFLDGIAHCKEGKMKARHHAASTRQLHSIQFGRLDDSVILGGIAALLAFAAVYAYTGSAGLLFAIVSAIGAGTLIYVAASSSGHNKS